MIATVYKSGVAFLLEATLVTIGMAVGSCYRNDGYIQRFPPFHGISQFLVVPMIFWFVP